MTAEELMTIANMGKGTDMSSYEHQDDVTRTFNFIQSIRKGEPIINTPTTPPVDIPPLPTE